MTENNPLSDNLATLLILCVITLFAVGVAASIAPIPLSGWMDFLTETDGPLFFTGPFWIVVLLSWFVIGFISIRMTIRSVAEMEHRKRELRERYS